MANLIVRNVNEGIIRALKRGLDDTGPAPKPSIDRSSI
jgi:hypothetical protein